MAVVVASGGVNVPSIDTREINTQVLVNDGQTVVLGGLITSTVNSTKDKVPIVGDVPLLGRLFQSQTKVTVKHNLMIFVTATIVKDTGEFLVYDDEQSATNSPAAIR